MSRKIDKSEFLRRFHLRFPDAKIEILEYTSLKAKCTIKCAKCGKEFTKKYAQGFLSSWNCCEGHNETKIEMIKRICNDNGHYEFIKQIDSLNVIIKHLDCGNELKKKIQSATLSPCSCPMCNTQSKNLRISLNDAQIRLDEKFNGQIKILFFDGVDNKSQFRCEKCGLIFKNTLENLVSKCRGCPKCDQRHSKGERILEKFLQEHNIEYIKQYYPKELNRLSFDFAILRGSKIIAFVEVQGEQHYKEIPFFTLRPNQFERQLKHDQEKREYCKELKLPLYEIKM